MQNASEKSDNKRKSNEHFHLIRFVHFFFFSFFCWFFFSFFCCCHCFVRLFILFYFSCRLFTVDWLTMHRPIQHTLKIMYKCIPSNIKRIDALPLHMCGAIHLCYILLLTYIHICIFLVNLALQFAISSNPFESNRRKRDNV